MAYKVIYEVSGRKVILGRYTTKKGAEKKVASEKQKHNFGKNGYREYLTVKLVK